MRKKIISVFMAFIIFSVALVPQKTHASGLLTMGAFAKLLFEIGLSVKVTYDVYNFYKYQNLEGSAVEDESWDKIDEETKNDKKLKDNIDTVVGAYKWGYSMQAGILDKCEDEDEVQKVLNLTDEEKARLKYEYEDYLLKEAAKKDYEINLSDEKNRKLVNGVARGLKIGSSINFNNATEVKFDNLDLSDGAKKFISDEYLKVKEGIKSGFFEGVNFDECVLVFLQDDVDITMYALDKNCRSVVTSWRRWGGGYDVYSFSDYYRYAYKSYDLTTGNRNANRLGDEPSICKVKHTHPITIYSVGTTPRASDFANSPCLKNKSHIKFVDVVMDGDIINKSIPVAIGYPNVVAKDGVLPRDWDLDGVITGVKDGTISSSFPVEDVGDVVAGTDTVLNPDKTNDRPLILPDVFKVDVGSIAGEKVKTSEGFDFKPLQALGASITNKFPFSLPWDFIGLVKIFSAPPKPPIFKYKLDFKYAKNVDFVIDLTQFDSLMQIIRFFMILYFLSGLIKLTGELTKH